jgi:hypothetical protein
MVKSPFCFGAAVLSSLRQIPAHLPLVLLWQSSESQGALWYVIPGDMQKGPHDVIASSFILHVRVIQSLNCIPFFIHFLVLISLVPAPRKRWMGIQSVEADFFSPSWNPKSSRRIYQVVRQESSLSGQLL